MINSVTYNFVRYYSNTTTKDTFTGYSVIRLLTEDYSRFCEKVSEACDYDDNIIFHGVENGGLICTFDSQDKTGTNSFLVGYVNSFKGMTPCEGKTGLIAVRVTVICIDKPSMFRAFKRINSLTNRYTSCGPVKEGRPAETGTSSLSEPCTYISND